MNKQGIDARGRIYIQVLVALGLLLMFVAPVSAGWYQGYQHRIKFNITGSSDGYLENWNGTYIKVFNTSGSNSGHDLYITDTINPDFSDIRIVDASNDQLMRSYINSYGSNYANITYIFDYLDKSEIRDVYVYWDNISAEQYSNNTEEVGDDIGAIPITNTQFAWDMESADNSNTWRLRPIEGSGSLGVIQHLPPSFSPLATFTDTSWYTEGAGSLAEKAAATGTDNPGADYYERNRDASYLYANFTTLRVNGSDAYTGHGATFTVDVKISSACYGDSPKPYNNTGSFWEPSSSTAQWAIFPTTNLPVTFKNCQMAPTPPDENGAFNDTPQTYDYTGTATMTIDGWGTTGYSADCVSGDRCEPVARTDAGVWTNRTTSWESHSNIYLDNIRDVHRVVTNVPGSQEFYAEENIPAYPTSDFTADPTSGTRPLEVTFNDTSDAEGATNWYWEFGDGNTSTEKNITNTYDFAGTFTVNHSVTNSSGTSWLNVTDMITVNEPVPAGEGFDSHVLSLLHMNGSANSTTFLDEIPTNTFAAYVNASIIDSPYVFGGASGYFDNTSYVRSDNANISGAKTLDFWMLSNSWSPTAFIFSDNPSNPGGGNWILYSSLCATVGWNYPEVCDANWGLPSTGVWHHYAIEANGSYVSTYLDGQPIQQNVCTYPVFNSDALIIGGPTYFFDGYIDEVRFSDNIRWEEGVPFTPPTAEYSEPEPVEYLTSDFTADPTSGIVPLEVTFNDTSTGLDITDYYWEFGDGNTSTATSPVYVYPDAGLFTVRHSVTNSTGTAWKNITDMITVNEPAGCGETIWTFSNGASPGDKVFATPVVSNGIVYAGDSSGTFYAVNNETGEEIWNYTTGAGIIGSAAVANGTVYVGSDDGYFYAFNATTGEEAWSPINYGSNVESTPVVAEDIVYISVSDGYLYALNAITGDEIWSYNSESYAASPTIGDGRVYISDQNYYYLRTLDASDGSELWNFPVEFYVAPTFAEGVIYVGGYNGIVYAVDASDGSELWNFTTSTNIREGVAVDQGKVFVQNDNGYTYAIDATTGEELWVTQTYTVSSTSSMSASANGVAYIRGSNGNSLYALNARTGTEEWLRSISLWGRSSPTVAENVVYVGDYNGNISALQACEATAFPYCKFSVNGTGGSVPFDIAFTDESVGLGITDYYWDFGDGGSPSTDTNPIYTYSAAGNFEVRHSVTNVTGTDWQNLTYIVAYDIAPEAHFIISPNYGQSPVSINFNDTSLYYPDSWLWDFGDGNSSTDQNPTHIYELIGLFDINLTACNAYGCGSNILTEAVDTRDLSLPTDGCIGYSTGTISAISDQPGYYEAGMAFDNLAFTQWMNAGADMPAWIKIDYGMSTTHKITNFSVLNSFNGTVGLDSFGGNDIAPAGFVLEGSNDDSIWDVLETHPSSSRRLVESWRNYSVLNQDEYRYYRLTSNFTYIWSNNNVAIAELNLYACTFPEVLTANFTASPTSGTKPLEVTFNDTSTGLDITDWYWEFGDGNTSTATSPVYVYPDAGLFTVRHSVTNSSGTSWYNLTDWISVSEAGVGMPCGKKLWNFYTGTENYEGPIIVNDIMYGIRSGGYDDYLYAVDINTESQLWKFSIGPNLYGHVVAGGGIVYPMNYDLWGSTLSKIYAVDMNTGEEIWNVTLDSVAWADTALSQDNSTIFAVEGSAPYTIHAFNALTGEEKWTFEEGTYSRGPSEAGGIVYFGDGDSSDGNYLYAKDITDGSEIWTVTLADYVYRPPTYDSGVLYVPGYNTVIALDASDGSEIWTATISEGSTGFGYITISNNTVYVGNDNDYIYAFNAADGSQVWGTAIPYQDQSYPTSHLWLLNDTLYDPGLGTLNALDAISGELLWQVGSIIGPFVPGWALYDGVLYNGIMYLAGSDNGFYAIGVYDNCPSTPDPAFMNSPHVLVHGVDSPTVTFTDYSSGLDLTNWSYDFGDGNSSALQNPTHDYDVLGDFIVRQTATNSSGTATYNLSFAVSNHDPLPTGTVAWDDESVYNDTVVGYTWDGSTATEYWIAISSPVSGEISNESVAASGSDSHLLDATGTWTINFIGLSLEGEGILIDSDTITVLPAFGRGGWNFTTEYVDTIADYRWVGHSDVEYRIAIVNPSSIEVYNESVGSTGAGSWPVDTTGIWTMYFFGSESPFSSTELNIITQPDPGTNPDAISYNVSTDSATDLHNYIVNLSITDEALFDLMGDNQSLLEVYGEDAQPLFFHIFTWDTATHFTYIFVRMPDIPTGANETIWFVKGPGGIDNPEGVFKFYDTFNDEIIVNATKWNITAIDAEHASTAYISNINGRMEILDTTYSFDGPLVETQDRYLWIPGDSAVKWYVNWSSDNYENSFKTVGINPLFSDYSNAVYGPNGLYWSTGTYFAYHQWQNDSAYSANYNDWGFYGMPAESTFRMMAGAILPGTYAWSYQGDTVDGKPGITGKYDPIAWGCTGWGGNPDAPDCIPSANTELGLYISMPRCDAGTCNVTIEEAFETNEMDSVLVSAGYSGLPFTGGGLLIADFTANQTSGNRPLSVEFTDTSDALSPINWSWEFGDGNTSTTQSPVHTYDFAGTFTVNHSVTNSSGTSWRNVTDMITVVSLPPGVDQNTTILLHMDGAANSTYFKDETGKIWTSTRIEIFDSPVKFGNGSGKFISASGPLDVPYPKLETPSATDLEYGTGDYTVDFWVNFYAWNTFNQLIRNSDSGSSLAIILQNSYSPKRFEITQNSTVYNFDWPGAALTTWHHIAVVRYSGTLTVYVDGQSLGSTSATEYIGLTGVTLDHPGYQVSTKAYLDEYRESNVSRWTANFTPPTAAYGTPEVPLIETGSISWVTNGSPWTVTYQDFGWITTNITSPRIVIKNPASVEKLNTTVATSGNSTIWIDTAGTWNAYLYNNTMGLVASSSHNIVEPTVCSPTQTSYGGYQVLTFTTPGICRWTSPTEWLSNIDYLVVGGGAGGGARPSGGGGGAGGFLNGSRTIANGTNYTVTVGARGLGGSYLGPYPGQSGSYSQFDNITAIGGGGGGAGANSSCGSIGQGCSGGSGGGGAYNGAFVALGTLGQGYNGGIGSGSSGGGGGGAGQVGVNASGNTGGNGGNGLSSDVTGTWLYYAGGGGGGINWWDTSQIGFGGLGGGGDGSNTGGGAPATYYGSGGGGSGGINLYYSGGNGYQGIVIIRHLGTLNPPVANFTASPESGSRPLTVTFNDTSDAAGATNWFWEFGDGNTSTAKNVSRIYSFSGLFTVRHSVTNSSATSWKNVTDMINVGGTATIESGTIIWVPNGTVRTNSYQDYNWSSANITSPRVVIKNPASVEKFNATVTANGANITFVDSAGTWWAYLYNNTMGLVSSSSISVTDYPEYGTIDWIANGTVKSGSYQDYGWNTTNVLAPIVRITDPASVEKRNVTVGFNGNDTIWIDSTGTWHAYLYNSSMNLLASRNFYVSTGPVVNFTTIPPIPPTSGVGSLNVVFTDTSIGPGITSYFWDFGDGNTSSAMNPTHNYVFIGLFTVKHSATNVSGTGWKNVTDMVRVVVPPYVDFAAVPWVGTRPLDVAFTDASGGLNFSAYYWEFGDGFTSTVLNPTHTYNTNGIFTVRHSMYSLENGTFWDNETNMIAVAEPWANFTVNATSGYTPLAIKFTDTSQAINLSTYYYDFGDGNSSILANPVHVYAYAGAFTVKHRVYSLENGTSWSNQTNLITATVAPFNQESGSIAWTAASAKNNTYQDYAWSSANVSAPRVRITNPVGVEKRNDSVGASGSGGLNIDKRGTWTVYLYNATMGLLSSDTLPITESYTATAPWDNSSGYIGSGQGVHYSDTTSYANQCRIGFYDPADVSVRNDTVPCMGSGTDSYTVTSVGTWRTRFSAYYTDLGAWVDGSASTITISLYTPTGSVSWNDAAVITGTNEGYSWSGSVSPVYRIAIKNPSNIEVYNQSVAASGSGSLILNVVGIWHIYFLGSNTPPTLVLLGSDSIIVNPIPTTPVPTTTPPYIIPTPTPNIGTNPDLHTQPISGMTDKCVVFNANVSGGDPGPVWFGFASFSGGDYPFRTNNLTVNNGNVSAKYCGFPLLPDHKYYYALENDAGYGSEQSFTMGTISPHPTTNFGAPVEAFLSGDQNGELNVSSLATAVMAPYMAVAGVLGIGLIIGGVFFNMALKQQSVRIPAIILLLTGGVFWTFMPPEFIAMAQVMIILSIAGIVFWFFQQRR